MSNNFLRSAGIVAAVTVLAFFGNTVFSDNFAIPQHALIATYVFFLVLSILLLLIFDFVARNFIDKSGFVFIAFLFLKALAIFAFLTLLQQNTPLERPLMLNFALVYLAYLFLSIYLCLRTLKIYQK